MKKLTVVFCLIAVSIASNAVAGGKDHAKSCELLADYAEQIMKNRQDGISPSEAIKIMNNAEPAYKRLLAIMIKIAYETPEYCLIDTRLDAIEGYRDIWYSRCMKAKSLEGMF